MTPGSNPKLTPEQIRRAVMAYDEGCLIQELAGRFNMSDTSMVNILRQHTLIRKQWVRTRKKQGAE